MFPGEVRNTELSQWFTDPKLALRIMQWADFPSGSRLLEPSAGRGAFIDAGRHVHSYRWCAVEIDERLVQGPLSDLSRAPHFAPVELLRWDFLDVTTQHIGVFDGVVMNCPYENEQDVAHVLHALDFAPRVVALLRSAFRHTAGRWHNFWRLVDPVREVNFIGRPEFGEGNGAMSDFTVWEFRRREEPRQVGESISIATEWWW